MIQHLGVCPAESAPGGAGLGAVVGAGVAENGHNVGVDLVQIRPRLPEGGRRAAVVLPQQAQQQVFRADIALLQLPRLLSRLLHCPPGPGRKPLFRPAGTAGAVGPQHDAPEHGLVNAMAQQDPGAQAVIFHHDAQQQVLRADITVAHLPGGQPGVLNGQFRPLGEFFIAFHKAYPLIPVRI